MGCITHEVNRRRVVQRNALAELAVSLHLGGQFSRGIHDKRQRDLVLLRKALGVTPQVLFGDVWLILENIQPVIIAHLGGLGVKVAGIDRRLE